MGGDYDFPGPCPSCSAIEGCSTEDERKKGVKLYCKGIESSLNSWKAMLFDVVVEFDKLSAGDKESIADNITLIKSLVKEIETGIAQLEAECPSDLSLKEKELQGKLSSLRVHYTKALSVVSPGFIGG